MPKRVNLALQGGGAHGAFTWGVLDALLESDALDIVGISGTSAGAMNAAVLADSLRRGGRAAARARLARFWRLVSYDGGLDDTQRDALQLWMGFLQSFVDFTAPYLAPAQIIPESLNRLRTIVEGEIDFAALRTSAGPKLFISATNVWTGRVKVFTRETMTADMVLASACLPTLFHPVEIEGEPYWDGGYMGNPALFPLYSQTDCDDIVLVQINPIVRRETLTTSAETMSRAGEITFNSSLLQEFRAIEFVARLIEGGQLSRTGYKTVRMHRIDGGAHLEPFGAASKLNANWDFFQALHAIGLDAGKTFLAETLDAIGFVATLDLRAELGLPAQTQSKP